jgi:hypothetical protein
MKHFALGDIVWKAVRRQHHQSTTLVDTADYTVDLTTHEFRAPAPSPPSPRKKSGTMTLIDAATDGVVDANDVTFTATSATSAKASSSTRTPASAATDLLLFWWDTASGLPVTLGGRRHHRLGQRSTRTSIANSITKVKAHGALK